jgi:hypothetical protein
VEGALFYAVRDVPAVSGIVRRHIKRGFTMTINASRRSASVTVKKLTSKELETVLRQRASDLGYKVRKARPCSIDRCDYFMLIDPDGITLGRYELATIGAFFDSRFDKEVLGRACVERMKSIVLETEKILRALGQADRIPYFREKFTRLARSA